ncbi:unnamed protein product [Phytophthora fragariaefolia]|uniref:Unnamed protein product n=1 Tax=Phytophthora fragariaefolia TaxID=1490495 RepID=A0A9W6Y2I3_9STRA|nr:unnamed protein product [Phytophthora fragariaefolia]
MDDEAHWLVGGGGSEKESESEESEKAADEVAAVVSRELGPLEESVRASQIDTRAQRSQHTLNDFLGSESSETEVDLARQAVSRVLDLSLSVLHLDDSQREATASLKLLSEASGVEGEAEDGSDDQQFAGRSSEFPPVHLAVGAEAAGRRRGSGPPDLVDRLEAVERLRIAEFAALKQELALLKAQLAQVAQTASNVQVDLGSKLNVFRTRVGALEQALAPSHQD